MPSLAASTGAQAIAVPWPPNRDTASEQPYPWVLTDGSGNDDTHSILHQKKQRDQTEQNQEWPPASFQITDTRVQADGGEEIDKEHVSHVQLEDHAVAGRQIDSPDHDREQQPANHRFRDVVFA
jgi:hypothetical protein